MKPTFRNILPVFIFFASGTLHSQAISDNISYGITFERGSLIPGDRYGKEFIRSRRFGSCSIHAEYRADTRHATPYDKSFGYPGIEAGLIIADYSSSVLIRPGSTYPSSIGYIIGLYGKFSRDLYNCGIFRTGYSISNGIGYCARPYSYPDNRDNEFIGSPASVYFSTCIYAALRPHPKVEFIASMGLKHFSNSALSRPNKGANSVGLSLGVKYYPAATEIPVYPLYNKVTDIGRLYFDMSAGCNLHTMIESWFLHSGKPSSVMPHFPLRPSFSASLSAMYRYHLKFSSGIGFDYIYAGYYSEASSLDTSLGNPPSVCSPHVLGVSLRHETRYRSIGLHVSLGYYLHRKLGETGRKMAKPYYETIGLRYYIPRTPLYLSYHVLAHLLRADSMQLNIGVMI